MPPRPPPTQVCTACVQNVKNRTETDEGKWTRRILDSYGAAAADEGLDEHLVGQHVQLLLLLSLSHAVARTKLIRQLDLAGENCERSIQSARSIEVYI